MIKQIARPRLNRSWIGFLIVLALFGFTLWQRISNRPVSMSDEQAIALTVNERRADGLTYRDFVERRFRVRCGGNDPRPIEFRVWRTEGIYEFVDIQAWASQDSRPCSDPIAVIAGIPLSREFDTSDYPDLQGRTGKVVPARKGRRSDAEPTWLVDFRDGAKP